MTKYLLVVYLNTFSPIDCLPQTQKNYKGSQVLVPSKLPEHKKGKQQGGQFHTTHLQALSLAEAPSPPLQSTYREKLLERVIQIK